MNLWPVEHFFHHFGDEKSVQLVNEVTSYKIHTLEILYSRRGAPYVNLKCYLFSRFYVVSIMIFKLFLLKHTQNCKIFCWNDSRGLWLGLCYLRNFHDYSKSTFLQFLKSGSALLLLFFQSILNNNWHLDMANLSWNGEPLAQMY